VKTSDPVHYQIRKEAILQQARHLFATKGYAETSMDDIAHANHIQKASLYHYFKSKQHILLDMIDLEGTRWTGRMRDIPATTDFRESLILVGKALLQNLDDPAGREFFQIIYLESNKNPAIFKAFKESPTYRQGPIFEMFNRHLEKRFPRVKIAMLVTQFVGGLIHYARLSRLHGQNMCMETFSDSDYVQQLADIFIKGMDRV
jgi:AcrR family transcriptional regulator